MKLAIALWVFSSLLVSSTFGQDLECPPEGLAYFPLHDCNKYVLCMNGEISKHNCPEGLLFNVDAKNCDFPQHVLECAVGKRRLGKNADCPPEGIAYVYHPDCYKFVICLNGMGAEMTCPHSLYYNPDTTKCDFSENVNKTDCTVGTGDGVARCTKSILLLAICLLIIFHLQCF